MTNESVAQLVQPLTSTMASPMRQIGGVFMEQTLGFGKPSGRKPLMRLASLGNSGVRPMQDM